MKSLLTVFLMFALSGCASQEAYNGYLDSHKASSAGYYEAASKPLVDITLPSPTGEPYHIVVNREIKPLAPEQIKDSEWTGPVNGLIRTAGIVGSIWTAGDALSKVTDNSGGNTTNTNTGEITTTTTTTDTAADVVPDPVPDTPIPDTPVTNTDTYQGPAFDGNGNPIL